MNWRSSQGMSRFSWLLSLSLTTLSVWFSRRWAAKIITWSTRGSHHWSDHLSLFKEIRKWEISLEDTSQLWRVPSLWSFWFLCMCYTFRLWEKGSSPILLKVLTRSIILHILSQACLCWLPPRISPMWCCPPTISCARSACFSWFSYLLASFCSWTCFSLSSTLRIRTRQMRTWTPGAKPVQTSCKCFSLTWTKTWKATWTRTKLATSSTKSTASPWKWKNVPTDTAWNSPSATGTKCGASSIRRTQDLSLSWKSETYSKRMRFSNTQHRFKNNWSCCLVRLKSTTRLISSVDWGPTPNCSTVPTTKWSPTYSPSSTASPSHSEMCSATTRQSFGCGSVSKFSLTSSS